jgi:predicted permease
VEDGQKTFHPVIINQTMAGHYWPNENPIGKRINGTPAGPRPTWLSVVGVVADVKQFGLDGEPTFDIYLPRYGSRMYLVIRTHSEPASLAAAVRAEIRKEDKDLPISKVQTMEQLLSDSVSPRRFSGMLLGLFAALALILAIVGIYGVISHSVSQRTHELGLRMALGAKQSDILQLVLKQGLRLILTGLTVGLLAAFAMSRFLSSLLLGVSPTDLPTFVGVSLLLTGVALLACYIPARRATKVDPMVALRYE